MVASKGGTRGRALDLVSRANLGSFSLIYETRLIDLINHSAMFCLRPVFLSRVLHHLRIFVL